MAVPSDSPQTLSSEQQNTRVRANLGDLPDLMPDLLAVDEDVVDH